jgi:hypothetical protein
MCRCSREGEKRMQRNTADTSDSCHEQMASYILCLTRPYAEVVSPEHPWAAKCNGASASCRRRMISGRGPEIMPVQVPGAAGLEPWRRSGRYPCRGDRQGRGEDRSGDGSADGGLSRLSLFRSIQFNSGCWVPAGHVKTSRSPVTLM